MHGGSGAAENQRGKCNSVKMDSGFRCLFEFIFFSVRGWVGHSIVKILTLGKERLDWGVESESNVTEALGLIFLLMIATLINRYAF